MGFNALFKSLVELAMKDTSSAIQVSKRYINQCDKNYHSRWSPIWSPKKILLAKDDDK